MDDYDLPTPRRSRARRPKVRTGCGTCKKRHLKCDERKPICDRCERSRYPCLGYADPKKKPPPPRQPEVRPLLPRPIRPSPAGDACAVGLEPLAAVPSPPEPSPVPWPSLVLGVFAGQEALYFDYCRRQLVCDLSQLSSSAERWTQHVLRQSMTDECVRQSVLAIGAMSHALHLESGLAEPSPGRQSSLSPPLGGQRYIDELRKAAVDHHEMSTSMFRSYTSEQLRARPSTVPIVTLLFVAFVFMQGKSGHNLIMSGIDLLIMSGIDLLRETFRDSSRELGAEEPDDAFEDTELILPRLAVMSAYSPFCKSQFPLLSSKLQTRDPPLAGHESIGQLRATWNSCFTGSMVFIMRAVWHNLQRVAHDVSKVRREQDDFLGRLHRWHYVLRATNVKTTDPADRECLHLVSIQYLFCSTFMRCCLDASELSYDGLEDEFRELLGLCEISLGQTLRYRRHHHQWGHAPAATTAQVQSSLGVGIVPVLVFIAAKCRVHKLRMSAIQLLQKLPWHQGMWDIKTVVAGHLAQIELEEEGRDYGGCIPSHSRYVWAAGAWDTERSRLRATFTRAVPKEDGTPVPEGDGA